MRYCIVQSSGKSPGNGRAGVGAYIYTYVANIVADFQRIFSACEVCITLAPRRESSNHGVEHIRQDADWCQAQRAAY